MNNASSASVKINDAPKAIVLFSGGQDSTTCLLWAIHTFGRGNVVALSFAYSQKHIAEIYAAQNIARRLNVPYICKNCEDIMAPSALTDHTIDVNAAHARNTSLPATFTAGRNALFLTIAASLAYGMGISNIVTGVCETDYSGYPDCRFAFIRAQEKALQLALEEPVKIHTPLMHMDKAETWKLAKQLSPWFADDFDGDFNAAFEIVRQYTVTDYNGDNTVNEWGRGKEDNPASKLRANGYREAKARGWV